MLLAIESQIHQEKDKEIETLLEKYTRERMCICYSEKRYFGPKKTLTEKL